MSRVIPPSVTYPSPNEWPITYRAITGITNSNQPTITAPDHGFTTSDINIVQVDFSQVKGMQEINGKFGFITGIIDDDNFTIALDTTGFHSYTTGGFANINAGTSPEDPFTNIA